MIRMKPQIMSTMIAVWSGRIRMGARKVRATVSFEKKVYIVACQILSWDS